MTILSVNINKIALLRNSRGRDFPNIVKFTEQIIANGVRGITVHPRPDERHITRADVYALSDLLKDKSDIEFNIEGYPSDDFIKLVLEICPDQCTLVPDLPGQLTSDHGWNIGENQQFLFETLAKLRSSRIRSCLFLDPVPSELKRVQAVGADRIELYTEEFASSFGSASADSVFQAYRDTAEMATTLGIGINAGHDLDLKNLAKFLQIPNILEVSIGHALVVESIQQGVESVIAKYLEITST